MRKIFISYRHEDSLSDTFYLRERLEQRFGKRRIFADMSIKPASDFTRVIRQQVAESDVLVAVIGNRWLTMTDSTGRRRLDDPEDWVRVEIVTALNSGICIIPCLMQQAKPLRSDELPHELAELAKRQALRISYESIDNDVGRLVEVIRQALREARAARLAALWARLRSNLRDVPTVVDRNRRKLLLLLASSAAVSAAGIWLVPRLRAPKLPAYADEMLRKERPASAAAISLPDRGSYFPSSPDWRDEVFYYILPDRFSDTGSERRPLLDRSNLAAARNGVNGGDWSWKSWSISGERWQGGTLKGIQSKLGYLQQLGISTIWLGPVFKQRGHADTYHGFAIQDFLDIEPRLGTRRDLVELVSAAHERGIRVILTIVFNHSGTNWLYPPNVPGGSYTPRYTEGSYPFGQWLGANGAPVTSINGPDDGVWPSELQNPDMYLRAGFGDLSGGDFENSAAEHKRTDFVGLRKFRLSRALDVLATCYKYWIALTDCDGFHFDTLQLISFDEARRFCDELKSYATLLGKNKFFLAAEVIGSEFNQDRYLEILSGQLHANLDAIVDNGLIRVALTEVARGRAPAGRYFQQFDEKTPMGRRRIQDVRRIAVLDDLDNVFGEKTRFSTDADSAHQTVTGVAFLLFTLGIPCLYYGTEQGIGGPETQFRSAIPDWGRKDTFLREALFGPKHPRKSGSAGLPSAAAGVDDTLPGFGPFGTAGHHCFDEENPVYVRIAELMKVRRRYPALRSGRQNLRAIRTLPGIFRSPAAGEIVAWARTLGNEEILCLVNCDPIQMHSADITAHSSLEIGSRLTVVANTMEAAAAGAYAGPHPVGSELPVMGESDGRRYVQIRNLAAGEVLLIASKPRREDTEFGKVADNYRISPHADSASGYSGQRGSR